MRMSLPTPPLPILQYSTLLPFLALNYTILVCLVWFHAISYCTVWYIPPLPSSLILVYQINNLNNLNHRRPHFPVLHPKSHVLL